MACFKIVIRRSADAEFRAVPFPFRRQINQRIMGLRNEPRPSDAESISERERYRLRVHGWRVVYEIDDAGRVVTISAVVKD